MLPAPSSVTSGARARGVGERELHVADGRGQVRRRRRCVVGGVHLAGDLRRGREHVGGVRGQRESRDVARGGGADSEVSGDGGGRHGGDPALREDHVVAGRPEVHRVDRVPGVRGVPAGRASAIRRVPHTRRVPPSPAIRGVRVQRVLAVRRIPTVGGVCPARRAGTTGAAAGPERDQQERGSSSGKQGLQHLRCARLRHGDRLSRRGWRPSAPGTNTKWIVLDNRERDRHFVAISREGAALLAIPPASTVPHARSRVSAQRPRGKCCFAKGQAARDARARRSAGLHSSPLHGVAISEFAPSAPSDRGSTG